MWRRWSVDADELGRVLLLLGLAGGLYTLASTRPRADSPIALGEKISWVALVAHLGLGSYVFVELRELATAAAGSPSIAGVVGALTAMLVLQGIVIGLLSKREAAGALEDERDTGIERTAARQAHRSLAQLLVVAILAMSLLPSAWPGWSKPGGVAHALVGLLLISELVRHATAVWLYRRDRV